MKKYNYESVIVSMADVKIFDYVFEGESEKDALTRAEKYYTEELSWVLSLYERFQLDYWQKRVGEVTTQLEKGCRVMSYAEFCVLQREHLLSREIEIISKEAFDDALNRLPPIFWMKQGGFEVFCFREFYRDTYTYQYAKDMHNGKCYRKLVDARDTDTWIPKYFSKKSIA